MLVVPELEKEVELLWTLRETRKVYILLLVLPELIATIYIC